MIDTKELRRLAQAALDRNAELLAKLEAAEKERDEFKRACFGHISDNSMLRAKIAEMEKQVPICRAEDIRHAEGLLPSLGLKPEDNLYALPGAQPAPSLASGDVSLISEGKTQPAPSVPVEVVDLYNFMCAAFVPMTPQQEQIAIQLELAKRAMLAAAPEAKP